MNVPAVSWTVVALIMFLAGCFALILLVIYRLHHPATNGHAAAIEGIWDGRTERRKSPR